MDKAMHDAIFAAACLNIGEPIDGFIKPDTVACAAWKSEDGKTIYYGPRHGDCIKECSKRNGGDGTYESIPKDTPPGNLPGKIHPKFQGFALADGSFATRAEAAKVALAAAQITGNGLSPKHREQILRDIKDGRPLTELTSEDLY